MCTSFLAEIKVDEEKGAYERIQMDLIEQIIFGVQS